MRSDLANYDWHIYGLRPEDLEYTVSLVKDIISVREGNIAQKWEKARKESPDIADDMMDDVAYYDWVENQFLWTFCIWRLQGIFEGIITSRLVPNKTGLVGLRQKLEAAEQAGYQLDPKVRNELLNWAKLRNALSHCPPEMFRPAPIQEADVVEYKELLLAVLAEWDVPGISDD
ncbi:MAG: hypothetical protein RID91_02625 [Azospirillaceae bacterium]